MTSLAIQIPSRPYLPVSQVPYEAAATLTQICAELFGAYLSRDGEFYSKRLKFPHGDRTPAHAFMIGYLLDTQTGEALTVDDPRIINYTAEAVVQLYSGGSDLPLRAPLAGDVYLIDVLDEYDDPIFNIVDQIHTAREAVWRTTSV